MADEKIPYTQYLQADGSVVGNLPEFAEDQELVLALYRHMNRARRFDTKAVAMQRTGRLPTFPPALGQEAFHVGFASAMSADDILFPTYRDGPAQMVRGVQLEELLLFTAGDERGSDFQVPRCDFPQAIPIATQTAHAVGAAYAMKLRGEKSVAVTTIGDGGSSKGDFYEAMNFAGVWQAPVIFLINNNGWAISTPRDRQSAAPTLAQKGDAVGVPGQQVDGNDVLAVYHVVSEAIAAARSGKGPALIEALTHRLTDHSTADDASRYRDADLLSEQWKEEPMIRLRTYLSNQGWWGKEDEESMLTELDQEIERAVENFEASDAPEAAAMFDYMYAELPADLMAQRAEVIAAHGHEGDGS
ncbi:MAG: pyruvate dehydrogenase (acetyl-transferring) E1 component subunit alpha [Proteobacteria bacterium]|nr:pyruvate dehydrogenase (acetyl-transferring) E1 component subunit alpha [Pseudomonadota bacterium]